MDRCSVSDPDWIRILSGQWHFLKLHLPHSSKIKSHKEVTKQ